MKNIKRPCWWRELKMRTASAVRFVRVIVDGKTAIHALDSTGNYATLCGLDGDDNHPACVQMVLGHLKRGKIDCSECCRILRTAWEYSEQDLKEPDRY